MKKILTLLLCIVVISLFASMNVLAAENHLALNFNEQSYVAITGNAGAEKAGAKAIVMLVKADADTENITKNDIGYISQQKISEDGTYRFEFGFSDFTYDAENNVDNYKVVLNVDGEKSEPTIAKSSVMSSFVNFEVDVSKYGKVVADIKNTYGLKDLRYTMIVGFYDENGNLLKGKIFNKFTGDSNLISYGYKDVPENTSYVKGFVWESVNRMIPVAEAKALEVESKPIKMLMIGNSLTVDATRYLTNLTKAGGIDLQYKTKVFAAATILEHAANLDAELNGRTVQDIYNTADNKKMIYGSSKNYQHSYVDNELLSTPLKNEQFDIISIQAYSSNGGGFTEDDFATLGKMVSQIRQLQPNAEIVIYEPWLHYRKTIEERNSNYLNKYAQIINNAKKNWRPI